MRNGTKTVAGGGTFWLEIPMSEGGSAADCLPPMSPTWLVFLAGMVDMDPWDLGDTTDI